MTAVHRHFPRAELAVVAEKLLADRRRGDPEAVRRNVYTPEKAALRERCAMVAAETLRASVDHRELRDAELRWAESGGTDGATWHDVRIDLRAVADIARASAANAASPEAEQHALKLIAIADLFEPAVEGRHYPLISTIAFVEIALRRGQAQRAAREATPPPVAPRPRPQRAPAPAGSLFG